MANQQRKRSMMISNYLGASSIDDLGDDLLIQLFQRVSCFKSLTLFKCVAKRWLPLIPPPSTNSLPWAFILVEKIKDKLPSYSCISMEEEHTNIFKSQPTFTSSLMGFLPLEVKGIAGSWRDIILCHATNHLGNMVFYLCNPLTKQWFPIPPVPLQDNDMNIDPSQGFAAGIVMQDQGEFRVVLGARSQFAKNMSSLKLHMFCSKTRQWRDLVLFYPLGFNNIGCGTIFHIQGVVCNGMMHLRHDEFNRFIAFDPFKIPVNNHTSSIDITEQCHFIHIPLMNGVVLEYMAGKLVESEGRVVCISIRLSNGSCKMVEVQELKSYSANGVWELIHRVDFTQMVSKDTCINNFLTQITSFNGASHTCYCYLLSMDTNNKDILYMIINDEGTYKLVSCHLPTMTLSFKRTETYLNNYHHFNASGICNMLGKFVFVLPWKPTLLPIPTKLDHSLV